MTKSGARKTRLVTEQELKGLFLFTINRGLEKFAAYEAEIKRLQVLVERLQKEAAGE